MSFAAYPQKGGDEWPISGIRVFEKSLQDFDDTGLLEDIFVNNADGNPRSNLSGVEQNLIFQPFGPAEFRYDLKDFDFFPLHGSIEKIAVEDLSVTSFFMGAGSGERKHQLLDKYRHQPWFCHDRVLLTIDRADRPPGHLILLLAKNSMIDLWKVLQTIRSMLFISEKEMDSNLAIDIFENRTSLERFHLVKEEDGLDRWDYIQLDNLTWLGSMVSDQWNIGKPEWADLSMELQKRARLGPAEIPEIKESPKAFGVIRMTRAVRENIPFSSLIRRADFSINGMPEISQVIVSTANRNNRMGEKTEMSRLRQKLMWSTTSAPMTLLWGDEFMITKWPGLNSILFQTIPRTGQVMLFSPTRKAAVHMLHIFYNLCLDELTFTLTRFISMDGGSLSHQGDFMKFFQTKIAEFFELRFTGMKIIEAWMIFSKGFMSIEGWFIPFYKPSVTVQNERVITTYPDEENFVDFDFQTLGR